MLTSPSSTSRPRTNTTIVGSVLGAVFAIVVSACSPAPVAVPVTADDAIASLASDGHADDVAECIVGLVTGRVDPAALVGDIQLTAADELAIDEATKNCELATELLSEDVEPPSDLAFDALPQNYGDDADLDRLWDDCADGLGEACDSLWEEAPIGSGYERFGVTCGERFEILNCTADMNDLEEGDQPDVDDAAETDSES